MKRDEKYGNLMHQVHVICDDLMPISEDGLVSFWHVYAEAGRRDLLMEEELFLRILHDLRVSGLIEYDNRGFLTVLVTPVAGGARD